MKYNEFKEEIENWGRKHDYVTEVRIGEFETALRVEFNSNIVNTDRFVLETDFAYFTRIIVCARGELFNILVELAKTPPKDRRDEKKYNLDSFEIVEVRE